MSNIIQDMLSELRDLPRETVITVDILTRLFEKLEYLESQRVLDRWEYEGRHEPG